MLVVLCLQTRVLERWGAAAPVKPPEVKGVLVNVLSTRQ